MPMDIARNTLWKLASRNWSWNWYVMLSKNETLQFTGNRWDRSYDMRFEKKKEIPSLIPIGSIIFGKARNKWRLQYCKNSCDDLLYVRAIQEHRRRCDRFGLVGHVAIPFEWKGFQCHRGCSLNIKSILDAGLIGAGKRKKTRTTNCILHTIRSVDRWDWRRIRWCYVFAGTEKKD